MWLGPVLFVAASVFLWKYTGAVFVPELLARWVLAVVPVMRDIELVILINAAILYFGPYFAFAVFWEKLRLFFKNPFFLGLAIWLANATIILPILGTGLFGYRMPQGWLAVSVPLLVAHWIFARGLQFQARRS